MRLFDVLKRNSKRRRKSRSIEYIYYKENEYLLHKYPYFSRLITRDSDFKIIQANIIIRALKNKEIIDASIKAYKDKCENEKIEVTKTGIKECVDNAIRDLPYLNDEENHRIYIPIFSKSLNIMYVDEPDKLLTYPYNALLEDFSSAIIDLFDVYNYKLYDSFFSKMIKTSGDKSANGFFNVDDYCLYIINKQGRLDVKICLFDRHLHQFNLTEIMKRVNKISYAYFNLTKEEFEEELYEQKFISSRIYHRIEGRKSK